MLPSGSTGPLALVPWPARIIRTPGSFRLAPGSVIQAPPAIAALAARFAQGLRPAAGIDWLAPAVQIEDRPRFGWRGSHLDVSRHFQPKAAVMKHLDLMSLHKLN